MAVAITDKNYLPNANSIINGNAELTAVSRRTNCLGHCLEVGLLRLDHLQWLMLHE